VIWRIAAAFHMRNLGCEASTAQSTIGAFATGCGTCEEESR